MTGAERLNKSIARPATTFCRRGSQQTTPHAALPNDESCARNPDQRIDPPQLQQIDPAEELEYVPCVNGIDGRVQHMHSRTALLAGGRPSKRL
jgi:hypothetical protein